MTVQQLKKKTEGFTIIEVLIVLAIAALILLIVFLAVPALQRNARNNGRKNDVARVGAAVNDFVANHNASFPTNAETATVVTNMGNMSNYAATDRVANASGAQAVLPDVNGQPHFRLVTGARCATGGATAAASGRLASIQYQLETQDLAVHEELCLDI